MIDATVSRWAKWIQDAVIPQFSYLIETLRNFRPFENTSPEELQFQCIRLAIYAVLLIILVSIGRKIGSWFMRTTAKKRKQKRIKKQIKKQIQQKKWSPTGWYWDEEKGEWVPPDYLNTEAKERWKWDDKKRIWIDLSKVQEGDCQSDAPVK